MQLRSYLHYGLATSFAIILTACGGGSDSKKETLTAPVVTAVSSSAVVTNTVVASSVGTSSVATSSVASSSASIAVVEDKTLVLPSSLEVVTNESAR